MNYNLIKKPSSNHRDESSLEKENLVFYILNTIMIFLAIFISLYFSLGAYCLAWILIGDFFLFVALQIYSQVWRISNNLASNLINAICSFGILIPTLLFSGGLDSPVASWIITPVLISAFITGKIWYSISWTFILAGILFTFSLVDMSIFPNYFSHPTYNKIFTFSIYFFLLLFSVSIISLFILKEKKTQNVLENIAQLLEKSNEMAKIGTWELMIEESRFVLSKLTRETLELEYGTLDLDIALEFIATEDRPKVQNVLKNAVYKKKNFDIEISIFSLNGNKKWVRIVGFPETKDETPANLYGTFQDITEKRQKEIHLQIAIQKAEDATKAKSEFLANMSHEIRTPLNGIVGFIDLLKTTTLENTQKIYVTYIHQSASSLLNTINDILDFSKIEARKLELEIEKISVRELVEEAAGVVQFQIDKKNLEFILNIHPNVPEFCMGDKIRLQQIIINLLGNSAKFTEKGEIEVKVGFKSKNENFGELYFSVRDTGIGISEQDKSKLFQTFSQIDTSSTRKYGGTGLGLAISNLLAQKMGTSIQFHSSLGNGSEFYFYLETNYEYDEKRITLRNLPFQKVLVIEPNPVSRKVLEDQFKYFGKEIISFQDADTAFNFIEHLDFDLGIVNYQLGKINAFSFIQKIRSLDNKLQSSHFILMHNSLEIPAQNSIEKLENISYIVKPARPSRIFEKCKEVFDKNFDKDSIDFVISKSVENRQYNILVTDDVEVNVFLLKSLIHNLLPTAVIWEASNGEEAYQIAYSHKLDLIFMDLLMPVCDGFEASQKIRNLSSENAQTPIIALTADATSEDIERIKNFGIDDYVIKPINMENLKRILETRLT